MSSVENLLKILSQEGNEELILESGKKPRLRKRHACSELGDQEVSSSQIEALFQQMAPEEDHKLLEKEGFHQTFLKYKGQKLKASLYKQKHSLMVRLRLLETKLKSWVDLNLYFGLESLLEKLNQGLVLISSPDQGGKSSTVKALVHDLQTKMDAEALFFHSGPLDEENSFGFSYFPMASLRDFRHLIKENPRAIVIIDEVEEPKWAKEALWASSKGHLVFLTMGQLGVESTYCHVQSWLNEKEQLILRENLRGVISQTLLAKKNSSLEKTPVHEFLILSPELKELLLNFQDLLESRRESQDYRSFELDLEEQLQRGELSGQTASEFIAQRLSWILGRTPEIDSADAVESTETSTALSFVPDDKQSNEKSEEVYEKNSFEAIDEEEEERLEKESTVLLEKVNHLEKQKEIQEALEEEDVGNLELDFQKPLAQKKESPALSDVEKTTPEQSFSKEALQEEKELDFQVIEKEASKNEEKKVSEETHQKPPSPELEVLRQENKTPVSTHTKSDHTNISNLKNQTSLQEQDDLPEEYTKTMWGHEDELSIALERNTVVGMKVGDEPSLLKDEPSKEDSDIESALQESPSDEDAQAQTSSSSNLELSSITQHKDLEDSEEEPSSPLGLDSLDDIEVHKEPEKQESVSLDPPHHQTKDDVKTTPPLGKAPQKPPRAAENSLKERVGNKPGLASGQEAKKPQEALSSSSPQKTSSKEASEDIKIYTASEAAQRKADSFIGKIIPKESKKLLSKILKKTGSDNE